jgi:hypothetical protein
MISSRLLAAFEMDSDADYVVLKMHGRSDLRLCRRAELTAARGLTEHILTMFRKKAEHDGDRLESLADAVRYLIREMQPIALMLAGQNIDRLNEIRIRFTEAWPQWQHATDVIPLVEIRSHDEDFPFELLPLFDWTPVANFANYAEAEYALRRFVGFGIVVRRTKGEDATVADLQAKPLSVQFITYESCGSNIERSFFEEVPGLIDVEGPWPGSGLDSDNVAERLIDALYDPARRLSGTTRSDMPVQIQHFACHCNTVNQTEAGYTLILGGPEHKSNITLGDIGSGFLARVQKFGLVSGPRPLIIANACGSAKIDKESRASFQKWFLSNGHRGFVGTETEVREDTAAHFAKFFYQELLDRRPFGEAVVRARRRLLAERASPLGLLYVTYGNPLLAITR